MMLALWSIVRFGVLVEVRYPVVFLSNVVSTALFLTLLLLGGRAIGVGGIEGALFITFIILAALQAPQRALEDNSAEPEEVYLYPIPPIATLIFQAIGLAVRTVFSFTIVYLALLFPLHLPTSILIDLWIYAPVAFLAGLGPGLLLGGFSLLFKRTGALVNLMAIIVLAGAFLPSSLMSSVGSYLPFSVVQGLMRGTTDIGTVAVVCGVFLSLGTLGYAFLERLVIRMGFSGIK